MIWRTVSAVVGTLFLCNVLASGQHAMDGERWDAAAAARALDRRVEAWDGWGKSQRSHETTCISCHTGGPYLLARPALNSFLPPDQVYGDLVGDVTRRVEHWTDVEPWYTFNAEKKAQSLGSEAIWNALILANRDRVDGVDALRPETSQAFEALWLLQEDDGGWAWLDFRLDPWEGAEARTYGAALAALAIGLAPGDYAADPKIRSHVAKLSAYLNAEFRREDQSVHNQLFVVWASTVLDGVLTEAEAFSFVDQLRALQRDDGGWSLQTIGEWRIEGSAVSDALATGLVTVVLQALDLDANAASIQRGLAWLQGAQDSVSGGWRSKSVNKSRDGTTFVGQFMDDAATAYAVLALTYDIR